MGKNKGKAPERSSARLTKKRNRNNEAVNSDAKEQVYPNDPRKKQEVEVKSEAEQQVLPDDPRVFDLRVFW